MWTWIQSESRMKDGSIHDSQRRRWGLRLEAYSKLKQIVVFVVLLGVSSNVDVANGFGIHGRNLRRVNYWKGVYCRATESDDFETWIVGDDAGGVLLNDLSWRVEKLRLEEQNTKRFLKSGPRFLPYGECRKWVQAWSRWETEDDWKNWIAMGEKRNPYIPSEPDIYYGRLGQWISWEHFLGTDNKKKKKIDETLEE